MQNKRSRTYSDDFEVRRFTERKRLRTLSQNSGNRFNNYSENDKMASQSNYYDSPYIRQPEVHMAVVGASVDPNMYMQERYQQDINNLKNILYSKNKQLCDNRIVISDLNNEISFLKQTINKKIEDNKTLNQKLDTYLYSYVSNIRPRDILTRDLPPRNPPYKGSNGKSRRRVYLDSRDMKSPDRISLDSKPTIISTKKEFSKLIRRILPCHTNLSKGKCDDLSCKHMHMNPINVCPNDDAVCIESCNKIHINHCPDSDLRSTCQHYNCSYKHSDDKIFSK